MKNALLFSILVVFACNVSFGQPRAKVNIEAVSPHKLTTLGLTSSTNSVSSGLHVVAKQTYVYLSPENIADTNPVTSAVYEVKRGAATITTTNISDNWAYFKADQTGEYTVKLTVTTATGTDDTTISVYSANYLGVGKFEDVDGEGTTCMSCHSSGSKNFTSVFNKWKESGHANALKIPGETNSHFSSNCFKCHTTGTDHNSAAVNNGFDDISTSWTYTTANSGMWDSLVTYYPELVNHATIGCESCHGPGSQHSAGGDIKKIAVSLKDGACAQCHDEPWRYNKVAQHENSLHAEAVWSSSFISASQKTASDNSLNNCIRCHDAVGYVNFTKGQTTDLTNFTAEDHVGVSCAACHDPHGNGETASLRIAPSVADTLGNGFAYTVGGTGKTCMNCHKARRDNVTYVPAGTVNSTWGPHHSVQTDVLLGQNAASFNGSAFMSGSHQFAIENACVDCHMYATVDTGNVNRDKVGGHSFSLHNEATGYDHTAACASCHGTKASFEEFEASADYDRDGTIEGVQNEIEGLLTILRTQLPPTGVDSVSYALIQSSGDLNMRKAYWNYMLIEYDGSRGMHNTKFAIDVLNKSIAAIGGVVPVELVSFSAEVEKGLVTLKWETASETNNKGFEVERKYDKTWKSVSFIEGKGTTSSSNKYSYSFNLEGTTSFRLKQVDMDGTFEYSKEIEVTGTVTPKEYSLSQNYPNPFNPSTTIKFALPYDSNVKVVIYNVTGEVVKVLVNSVQAAGNHEAKFSANELGIGISSGIYFYSLEANSVDGKASFRQTKKMVLMK
jgi:hypothetical protein